MYIQDNECMEKIISKKSYCKKNFATKTECKFYTTI